MDDEDAAEIAEVEEEDWFTYVRWYKGQAKATRQA